MRDPYLWEDARVLRNLLNIKNSDELDLAEADITGAKLFSVDEAVAAYPFDFSRLCAIHRHVFGDIYEWAGVPRVIEIVKGERVLGGDTVRYSPPDDIERDCTAVCEKLNALPWSTLGIHETADAFARLIAALWQCHPFREGNTRTVITFAAQFAEAHSFRLDKSLLRDNAEYVRNSLVKASDGEYSDFHYLTEIFEDAIIRG
jgi:cell filamentation protein